MSHPRISIVLATYNRGHLLGRSLKCYTNSTLKDFELVVVDDGSTDDSQERCREWMGRLDLKYILYPRPENLKWRDGASIINFGLRACSGDLVIQTHPEVMVGYGLLQALWDKRASAPNPDKVYYSGRPYYLTIPQQEVIDTCDWPSQGPVAVRVLPNFYGQLESWVFTSNLDYVPEHFPENIEKIPMWESFVFGGFTRKGWLEVGGIPPTSSWGSVDLIMLRRRHELGFETYTPKTDDCYCVHQSHNSENDVRTPRDMAAACAGADNMKSWDEIRWSS